jgi:hypothetical protein
MTSHTLADSARKGLQLDNTTKHWDLYKTSGYQFLAWQFEQTFWLSHNGWVFVWKLVSPKLLKTMGWSCWYLSESIIGGHCSRPITITWILTDLWPFLNIFFIIQAHVLYSAFRIIKYGCPTDSFCWNIVWVFLNVRSSSLTRVNCLLPSTKNNVTLSLSPAFLFSVFLSF